MCLMKAAVFTVPMARLRTELHCCPSRPGRRAAPALGRDESLTQICYGAGDWVPTSKAANNLFVCPSGKKILSHCGMSHCAHSGMALWTGGHRSVVGSGTQGRQSPSGVSLLHHAACLVLKDVSIALIKQHLETLLGTGALLGVMSD